MHGIVERPVSGGVRIDPVQFPYRDHVVMRTQQLVEQRRSRAIIGEYEYHLPPGIRSRSISTYGCFDLSGHRVPLGWLDQVAIFSMLVPVVKRHSAVSRVSCIIAALLTISRNGVSQTRRFVILGTQRTGTTLVRTCLNSHPDVLCCGEVFKLAKPSYKKPDGLWHYTRRPLARRIGALVNPRGVTADFLDNMYSEAGYKAIGFKLMLSHQISRPYIWPMLEARGVSAIIVRRRNLLKTLVSRRSAAETGVYHVSRELGVKTAVDDWQSKGVALDTATLVADLEAIDAETENWQAKLSAATRTLEIVYEDYASNIDSGNQAMLEFLGVRPMELKSDLKKVNPDDLRRSIRNYDDVASTLRDSRFEAMLATG